ncbi:hypothetical protein EZV62_018363 [Acer yangbiense]|uniref:CCHC-type domain-containing protein n=1 Tax=Acer yangbiense TaxID=1000413 RepID=A0A5C7HJ72_9ROSI|nr:hypothetical protein EZV62_018363 [Acer yangbiense]
MFEADISKLYKNLTLADEDGAVHEMAEEVKVDGVEDVEKCLVGKVLVGKKVNREAFKGLIEQIWSPFGSVEIELVEDNIFMFYFNNCNTEEITRVSLKYERLSEFCFACGKIGHDIKACVDENAKKAALDGSPNKFGSWLKATIPDRTKSSCNVQGIGSSSDRTRSKEASRETEGDGSETLMPVEASGPPLTSVMCIDGPDTRLEGSPSGLGLPATETTLSKSTELVCLSNPVKALPTTTLDHSSNLVPAQEEFSPSQPMETDPSKPIITPKKKISKRWKRAAREVKVKSLVGLMASPLHRILEINKQLRKSPKVRAKVDGHVCKRKVVFDLPEEKIRESKKGKVSIPKSETSISTEPDVQARREQ